MKIVVAGPAPHRALEGAEARDEPHLTSGVRPPQALPIAVPHADVLVVQGAPDRVIQGRKAHHAPRPSLAHLRPRWDKKTDAGLLGVGDEATDYGKGEGCTVRGRRQRGEGGGGGGYSVHVCLLGTPLQSSLILPQCPA